MMQLSCSAPQQAVQLREMLKSTEDRRAEICLSFAKPLYSAAYARHC